MGLALLHLATECLDQGTRLISQRHHDRRWRIAALQIEFAQPVECADRPLRAGRLSPEPKRNRLRPGPQDAGHQPVIRPPHQQGQPVGLRR